MVTIVLDAGHGGQDGGASANGLKEKHLVLSIAKGIQQKLKNYQNVNVVMTRSTDVFLTLQKRCDIELKNKAHLFISIHVNAGGGTGFESFVDNRLKNDSRTVKRQVIIHDYIVKELKALDKTIIDRGTKKANYFVLQNTGGDAVLTENLFIDTKKDADKLKDNKYLNAIIEGHVKGIVKIFQLRKKVTDVETPPPDNQRDTVYRVICGSYKEKKNATAQNNLLKKEGFDSFLLHENGLYRVVVGSFADPSNARKRVTSLKEKGYEAFLEKY